MPNNNTKKTRLKIRPGYLRVAIHILFEATIDCDIIEMSHGPSYLDVAASDAETPTQVLAEFLQPTWWQSIREWLWFKWNYRWTRQ